MGKHNIDKTAELLRNSPGYCYLATPYSKWPGGIEDAFRQASRMAGELVRRGVAVYSPIAHTHPIAIHSGQDPYAHDLWMPLDFIFLRNASSLVICKMPGWDESKGIEMERAEFEKSGRPVHYIEWAAPSKWAPPHVEKRRVSSLTENGNNPIKTDANCTGINGPAGTCGPRS